MIAVKRLNIQLDDETAGRLTILAFQTQTSAAEVIRRCLAASLDAVELQVVSEASKAGRIRPFKGPAVAHMKNVIKEVQQ